MFNGRDRNPPEIPIERPPENDGEPDQMDVGGDRVRVEDALQYLERVKVEFITRPEIYTSFLDIMKDFKSQVLDTHGVIRSVSILFNDYPHLIMGFNAFLPPGFNLQLLPDRIIVMDPDTEAQYVMPRIVPPPMMNQPPFVRNFPFGLGLPTFLQPQNPMMHMQPIVEGYQQQNLEERRVENENEEYDEEHEGGGEEEGEEEEAPEGEHFEDEEAHQEEYGEEEGNFVGEHYDEEREEAVEDEEEVREEMETEDEEEDEEEEENVSDERQDEDSEELGPNDLDIPEVLGCYSFMSRMREKFISRPESFRTFSDIVRFGIEAPEDFVLEDLWQPGPSSARSEFVLAAINELFVDEPDGLADFIKHFPNLVQLGRGQSQNMFNSDVTGTLQVRNESTESSSEMPENTIRGNYVVRVEPAEMDGHAEQDDEERTVKDVRDVVEAAVAFVDNAEGGEDFEMNEAEPAEDQASETPADFVYHPAEGESDETDEAIGQEEDFLQMVSDMRKSHHLTDVERKLKLMKESKVEAHFRKMLSSPNRDLFVKICKTIRGEDLKRAFQLFQLFLTKKINQHELINSFRNIASLKYENLYESLGNMFGIDDDDSDTDSESVVFEDSDYDVENLEEQPREHRLLRHENSRDLDMATICTLGVSYRKIRKEGEVRCSGMTDLCREVLNDNWTSYPSWSSEDNGNVSSKKSGYEEFLYRTEDERFELDICLDVNKYAIEAMEFLKHKLEQMSEVDRISYTLDENFGCKSGALMTRAIRRIYGEAASQVTVALRENPSSAIPVILKRCIDREEEWRDGQKTMNKTWREQLEKQMVRSLDHQTATIKQNDAKLLKIKTIIQQVEQFFDLRQANRDFMGDVGPHITYECPVRRQIYHDVNDIIIHYLKRQQHYSKEDKRKMKIVLRKIVLEWYCVKQEDMSDDERDEELDLDRKRSKREMNEPLELDSEGNRINLLNHYADDHTDEWPVDEKFDIRQTQFMANQKNNEYRLYYGDDSLFLFSRFHHTICDRLARIHSTYLRYCEEYHRDEKVHRSWERNAQSVANRMLINVEGNWGQLGEAIRSIRNVKYSPLTYYNLFINEIKRNLDGEMDASAFEDSIRQYFPTEASLFFSIDKLLAMTVKLLSTLANHEDECHALKMYLKYRLRTPSTVFKTNDFVDRIEKEYTAIAEHRLHGKNCYKFEFNNSEIPYMNIQLVDTEDSVEDDTEREENTGSSGHESSSDDRLVDEFGDAEPPVKKAKLDEGDGSTSGSRSGSMEGEGEEEEESPSRDVDRENEPSIAEPVGEVQANPRIERAAETDQAVDGDDAAREDRNEEVPDEDQDGDDEDEDDDVREGEGRGNEGEGEADEGGEGSSEGRRKTSGQAEEDAEKRVAEIADAMGLADSASGSENGDSWTNMTGEHSQRDKEKEIMRAEAVKLLNSKKERAQKTYEVLGCSRFRKYQLRTLPLVPVQMFMQRVMDFSRRKFDLKVFNYNVFNDHANEVRFQKQGGFYFVKKPKAVVDQNAIRSRKIKMKRWLPTWHKRLDGAENNVKTVIEKDSIKSFVPDRLVPSLVSNVYRHVSSSTVPSSGNF